MQVNRDCRGLADFLKRFEVFYPIVPFAKTQESAPHELCEDSQRGKVIYFQARFAPALAASPGFTMEDAVERRAREDSAGAGAILASAAD